jgi:hypothetical protein
VLQIATRDSVLVIDLKGLGERDREEDEGNGKEGTSGKGGGAMMRELNDALSLVMPRTSTFFKKCAMQPCLGCRAIALSSVCLFMVRLDEQVGTCGSSACHCARTCRSCEGTQMQAISTSQSKWLMPHTVSYISTYKESSFTFYIPPLFMFAGPGPC